MKTNLLKLRLIRRYKELLIQIFLFQLKWFLYIYSIFSEAVCYAFDRLFKYAFILSPK